MLRRSLPLVLLCLVVALLVVSCSSSKGPSYSLQGVILGTDGVGIMGVPIAITGGTTMTVTTGEGGRWEATGLRGEVTVTPSAPGMEFYPKQRVFKAGGKDIVFTGNFGGGDSWVVEFVDGDVWRQIIEGSLSPRFQRLYLFRLWLANNSGQDGRILVWLYVDGVNRGGGTFTIPTTQDPEVPVSLPVAFRSDVCEDNVYDDLYIIIEGLLGTSEPVLIQLEGTEWHPEYVGQPLPC